MQLLTLQKHGGFAKSWKSITHAIHGSWLNMAEIELSVLSRQCLSGRISSIEIAKEQVMAWQQQRNQAQVSINWRFTTSDARIKLKRLYPVIEQ